LWKGKKSRRNKIIVAVMVTNRRRVFGIRLALIASLSSR
jgi:hypothetical protein